MNQPIEGLREEQAKIDGRSREARAMRSSPREEVREGGERDSIREAELRAQEIMDNLEGEGGAFGSELDIPANLAPPGWEYQLRRVSVAGMEDRHHQLGLLRSGWTPVPASRHPHLMPAHWQGAIEIKGLMLMEKPKILVDRSRAAEEREALDQIRNSEAKLHEAPPNTGPRDHPKTPVIVSKELMRPVGGEEPRRRA